MTKMTRKTKRTVIGSLIFGGVAILATASVMIFVPNESLWLEIGVLAAGLVAGSLLTRFGISTRWMSPVVLVLFITIWFALGAAGYAWFGGFMAGAAIGVAWAHATKHLRPLTASKKP